MKNQKNKTEGKATDKKTTTSKGAKQSGSGEPKKGADRRRADGAELADNQDKKRGNIGPSGQGSHRGRETKNKQTAASGRPNVGSTGSRSGGKARK